MKHLRCKYYVWYYLMIVASGDAQIETLPTMRIQQDDRNDCAV